MSDDALFTAHIITSEAHALGDPTVIVMSTESGGKWGNRVIAQYPMPGTTPGRRVILAYFLRENGWTVPTDATMVTIEPGYLTFDVERI